MKQKIRRMLAAFIVLLLCTSLFSFLSASAERVVRVGIFSLGNFQSLDADNEPKGYNADYLARLEQATHWSIEYVACANWVEATGLLESGQIDLLAPAQKIASLEEKFDYAVYSMGTEFAAVYTLSTRDDLLYEDSATMGTLRYGGAENSTFTAKFVNEYSAEHGFTPDMTLYADTGKLFEALTSGEVDAIVTNIMFYSDDLKILARFSPMPVYYITQKNNTALLKELDAAMTDIQLSDPSYQTELLAQYFPIFGGTQLTYDEMEYVKKLGTVTVGYEVNHEPLSYTDEKTGQFAGITRDILDKLSAITGITFEYVPLPASNVTYDVLENLHIYVLSDVEYNTINQKQSRMSMTAPYLESEKVIVAKNNLKFDADSALSLAVATGSATLEQAILNEYPNFTVKKYASVEECFEAVRKGEADALLQNRYVVENYLTRPLYTNMSVIPIQSLSDRLSLATINYVNDTSAMNTLINDGRFVSIMEKAIKQLTTRQINAYIISNTANNTYQWTLADTMYQYRFALLAIVFLVAVVIWSLMRSRAIEAAKNKELALKNEQLSDAICQAEKASRAKGQFLSRMSHEIRTPMNAIVGISSLAHRHLREPEKMEDCLNKIDVSSRVLLNIINDVLDMSAIENEKMKIASAEFDLKSVLNGISTIYYPQCKQKGIEFSMPVDVTDEMLVGDGLRVNQILLNLVSNAYKFTDKGGKITVAVTQTQRKGDTVYLRFTVSDTGCGMSPDMLERLFKPFEQESATTAQKHGGSGLGMSIAKNLTDMMHGTINVMSKKGEGTTFTVDLPFGIGKRAANDNPEKLHDLHALIVDDDPNAREYTAAVLNRIGVKYDEAESGEKAVLMLKKLHEKGQKYDVCFVDWKMPDVAGCDVVKEIRALYDENTTIIVASAYDRSEVEDEAKAAGANMFVPKPLFQSTVFNLLMSLSSGKYVNETADAVQYDFTGKKVLLAEDNELNTEIAMEQLHIVNAACDHAANGQEAVDMFVKSAPGTYDMILMDVQMPLMDGHEASRHIRASQHPQAKTIPIYAMTANAFTEDVSAALSAGMNGHIAKPIDTDILYSTMKKAMNV